MPEYLAPGVFVEEVSFRSKSIEGVSTTTTGFVGATRFGPVDLPNELLTSVGEFERAYGGRQQLSFSGASNVTLHNYMWHAVRAFFEEGGKRLYISRVFRRSDQQPYLGVELTAAIDTNLAPSYADGHARATLEASAGQDTLLVLARYPGAAGNQRVRFTLRVGQNILSFVGSTPRVGALSDYDVVLIQDLQSPIQSPPGAGEFYLAKFNKETLDWDFVPESGATLHLSAFVPAQGLEVRVLTLAITVSPAEREGIPITWDGIALDKRHTTNGEADSLYERFRFHTEDPTLGAELPIIVEQQDLDDGLDVLAALSSASLASPMRGPALEDALVDPQSSENDRSVEVLLKGGNDGDRPQSDDYKGAEIPNTTRKTGLFQFEDIEDISIVAAPGSTFGYDGGYKDHASAIVNGLISHCQRMRYRIAVLDSGEGQTIAQVRAMRARIDSTYAALYYPWIRVLDPETRVPIFLPPSGFVSGIYARNDVNRAVYKAPANEVVNLALGFEVLLNKAQQEVLNPEGINAFRFFEGRGFRLWGARTVSSDPEWKYVNLRRYFAYLERSIDRGTQWAVFEPNGEALWANVRRTIEDFLLNEWQSGALLGDKPEKAYFVKCDRSTMTQNDLDNGRLICLIGVAPLRPAEFVIFRIGQWTADVKR
jgi:hypothetical protein